MQTNISRFFIKRERAKSIASDEQKESLLETKKKKLESDSNVVDLTNTSSPLKAFGADLCNVQSDTNRRSHFMHVMKQKFDMSSDKELTALEQTKTNPGNTSYTPLEKQVCNYRTSILKMLMKFVNATDR